MSKAVLISIQPKWCELIASGEKMVEVRKTKPKLETPFKVYIYETQGRTETPFVDEEGHEIFKGRGQVIGEFVCRNIDYLNERDLFDGMDEISNGRIEEYSCLSIDELLWYKVDKQEIYGWHITDLVIYDEPKDLREFKPYNRTEDDCKFSHLGFAIPKCEDCHECYVKRPPQSWCYVEELN